MRSLPQKKVAARLVLLSCLLGLLPAHAYAWGKEGHRIVARIAARHLTAKSRAAIAKILLADKQDLGQCKAIKSIEAKLACVSTWADDARTPATAPFHFTDIPLDGGHYDEGRDCPAEGCSIRALRDFRDKLLNSNSPSERAIALKFIVHLIGDLHQPLHNAQDRDKDFDLGENAPPQHAKLEGDGHSDLGGNTKPVSWFSETKTFYGCFNLHSVWDDGIINRSNPSDAAYAASLDKQVAAGEVANMQEGDIVEWANEAFDLAVGHAYQLPEPLKTDRTCEVKVKQGKQTKKVCTAYTPKACRVAEVHYRYHLGQDYYAANLPIVETQLIRGGLRLAKYLNSILDPNGTD
jgi:hypothetical protein